MRSKIPLYFILFLFATLIETYVYNGLQSFFVNRETGFSFGILFFTQALLSISFIIVFVENVFRETPGLVKKPVINVFSGLAFTFLLTKLSFISVMFVEDVFRAASLSIQVAMALFSPSSESIELASRNIHMAQIGVGVATIPFLTFIHGITLGKYKYQVKRVVLKFTDLPDAFHGFKILQFSDMHSGSFDSVQRVQKGIELMKSQEADLILFTGDMVNNHADEVRPFVEMLTSLSAKHGKYSILGNHDYGDYIPWANREAKIQNIYKLIDYQEKAGFQLLMNEHVELKKSGQSIYLAGVENWGKPPFPQHGDLQKALQNIPTDAFTVLMSHDPSHWDLEVVHEKRKVHITLSGHTHGMQMGIDIPGLKWSPVKYKYKRWSGLYEIADRYLYVNKGFGFLGFPGRVGMYPEITVFELEKK